MPFENETNPEVIAKSATVSGTYTQEFYHYLVSLIPTPESFTGRHHRLTAAYPDALQGDPEKIKAVEEDCKAVKDDLSLLLGLAKVVAFKDPTIQETLGFGHVTVRTATVQAPLGHPKDFKVYYDRKGQLFSSVTKVPGAKGYQVWVCDGDPSIEANWRLLASSSNCKGILLLGLNRSKFNLLRIRPIRGREVGPWSNWISLDPA